MIWFGRMSRSEWSKAKAVFYTRLRFNVGTIEFKKRAQRALTSNSGRQCSNREFILKDTKRRKTVFTLFEGNTLFEYKVQADSLKMFKEKPSLGKQQRVEDVERTKKTFFWENWYTSNWCCHQGDRILHLRHQPLEHVGYSALLQAAHFCYQEMIRKEVKLSVWKECILKKIDFLKPRKLCVS